MKTKQLLQKTLILVAVLLGGVSSAWGAAGDPTNMPTTMGTSVTLDKSKATSDGVNNTTETTGEYGSISNGNSLLFKLENSVAQQYTISYLAGTSNSNNSVKVQILSSADAKTADYEGTINLYNSGAWGNWCQYAFTTSGNVTTGTKYLKLIFQGSGFICNAKNITITAGTKPNSSTLVEIPAAENAAYTFNLDEKVTYTSNTGTGSDVPNKKTSGTTPYYDNYGGSGMVTYALYNNTNQYYRISFHGATGNATSSFTFIVLDAMGNEEATSTFSISTTSWTTFDETTLKSFTTSSALTTGHKTFILKFQNVNVANLTFTPAEAATQYTVTTSSNPAIGGTVFGAGTYDSGSNVNITQKAKWGYQFSSWTVSDAAAGSESSYTISSIAANTNVVGNFSIYDGIFQSIPTAAESYLDLTLANPDLATNGTPKAEYLDNYRGGEQTQFALRSTAAQRYYVSFKTARNDAGTASLTFSFATKAAPETTVFSIDKTIESNGSWTNFDNTYDFETSVLAAGDWILTITFNGSGTTCNMKDFSLTVSKSAATIGSTGWTTFSSAYPLDLSNMTASTGDVTAYYASSASGSSVTMTSTTATVAAGTGIMLKGTVGATITIPVVASGDAISGNKLVGCPTDTELTTPNSNYYVLVNNEGAEFQNLSGSYTDNKVTIPAGKAYLDLTGVSLARSLRIVFAGDITGINEAAQVTEATEKEGKFIVDGQLVIKKNGKKYNANGAQLY